MRERKPDVKKALSLIESAKDEINFTLTLKLDKDSANTIVRNIYESFRMLGQALLIAKGKEIPDHITHINDDFCINRDVLTALRNDVRKLRDDEREHKSHDSEKDRDDEYRIDERILGLVHDVVCAIKIISKIYERV